MQEAGPRPDNEITQLLLDDSLDDKARAEKLWPLVYEELRAGARHAMAGERNDHTLQPTVLVNEIFVRLGGERKVRWANRAHFYTAAAEAMRRVLLDQARSRSRIKRGGEKKRVAQDLAEVAATWSFQETVDLDDAIGRLGKVWPDVEQIVRLRFYAGLSVEETAEVMKTSARTIKRRWRLGRAWLARELGLDGARVLHHAHGQGA